MIDFTCNGVDGNILQINELRNLDTNKLSIDLEDKLKVFLTQNKQLIANPQTQFNYYKLLDGEQVHECRQIHQQIMDHKQEEFIGMTPLLTQYFFELYNVHADVCPLCYDNFEFGNKI